jgi:hypothetical protein
MQRRLAELVGVAPEQVGLKAKTMEGLGAIGAGEAIAALAVATVEEARRAVARPRVRKRISPQRTQRAPRGHKR